MTTGGTMDTLVGKLFNSKELDLRTEMDELFSGEDFSEKKGVIFVHRKLKRNPLTNKRVPCSCNTSLTVSGEKGCPYCDGIGYLWDDKFIEAYLYNERYISFTSSYSFAKAVGREFNEQYIFITKHTNRIEEGDMMFELKKDDNGKIISPFNIDIEFLITANKYMGFIRNLGEYTLAVGEIMNRNDYVGTKLY